MPVPWRRLAVASALPAAALPVVLVVHAPPAATLIWPLFLARPAVWAAGLACTAVAFYALHRSRPDERLVPLAAFVAWLGWSTCQGCVGLGLAVDGPTAASGRDADGRRLGVVRGYVGDSIRGEFVYDCGRAGIVCTLSGTRPDGAGVDPDR